MKQQTFCYVSLILVVLNTKPRDPQFKNEVFLQFAKDICYLSECAGRTSEKLISASSKSLEPGRLSVVVPDENEQTELKVVNTEKSDD